MGKDSRKKNSVVNEEIVREILGEVLVPGVMRSLVGLNLVRDIALADRKVSLTLGSAALSAGVQDWIKTTVEERVEELPDVDEVDIEFTDVKPAELNQVDHVIAIMSGKGGVGKSLVTSLVAVALKRQGYEVGVLDADLTGPSIPMMFGVTARPGGSDTGILPVISRGGIEIMSINLLLPSEDDAVIWRGPLIANTIRQFWEDVLWGKLDYLIIDLPPGTADAPLTVMQSLPLDGVIIVFTPQDLTKMIVKKAVNMAKNMGKPVLGVVENMSYLYIPEMDKKIELFGRSKGEETAKEFGAPLLGQLPVDPELAKLCDQGDIESYDSEIINRFGEAIPKAVSTKAK